MPHKLVYLNVIQEDAKLCIMTNRIYRIVWNYVKLCVTTWFTPSSFATMLDWAPRLGKSRNIWSDDKLGAASWIYSFYRT